MILMIFMLSVAGNDEWCIDQCGNTECDCKLPDATHDVTGRSQEAQDSAWCSPRSKTCLIADRTLFDCILPATARRPFMNLSFSMLIFPFRKYIIPDRICFHFNRMILERILQIRPPVIFDSDIFWFLMFHSVPQFRRLASNYVTLYLYFCENNLHLSVMISTK